MTNFDSRSPFAPDTREAGARLEQGTTWSRALLVGVGYIVLGLLARMLKGNPNAVSLMWMPSGLAIAVLLISERRAWKWHIGAYALGGFIFHATGMTWPPLLSVIARALDCATVLFTAFALQNWVSADRGFTSARQLIGFFFIGGIAFTPKNLIYSWFSTYVDPSMPYWRTFVFLDLAELLGFVSIAPVAMAWLGPESAKLPRPAWPRLLEIAAALGLLLFCVHGLDQIAWLHTVGSQPVIAIIAIWGAVRLGTRGVSLISLGFVLLASCYPDKVYGYITKSDLSPDYQKIALGVSLSLASYTGLIAALVFESQRRSEAALRHSEERYARATRGTSDGLWDWNLLTGDCYLSPRWKQLLGYEGEGLPDTIATVRNRIHPEDLARFQQILDYHLLGQGPFDLDLRLRTHDNTYRWFRLRGQVEWDEHRHPRRLAGAMQDVHGQKLAEAALHTGAQEIRRKNTELQQALDRSERLAADLKATNAVLQEATHAKTEFIRIVSHELRNPLAGARIMSELLARSITEPHAANQVAKLRGCVTYLQTVLDDTLDMAQVELGQTPVRLSHLHLGTLVRDTHAIFEAVAAEKSLRYTADAGAFQDAWFFGDATHLQRILVNFLSNAFKFTFDGFIHLAVQRVHHTEHLSHFRFTVSDSGPGVPPELHSRMFTAYVRSGDSRSSDGSHGAGLGLALSRHLAELAGGRVGFESPSGQGARFWVEIPLIQAPASNDTASVLPPRPDFSHLHVLFVDDDPMQRDILTQALDEFGVAPCLAGSVADALDILQQDPFDLVLIDFNLGASTGIELMKQLRLRPSSRVPLCHLISAHAPQSLREAAHHAGFISVHAKPLSLATIYELLSQAERARQASTGNETTAAAPLPLS